MWGNSDRIYWGRRERGAAAKGTVVLFAWLSSQERYLKPYVDLYGSLGWNSLVCHVDFLTLFFPGKATSLALQVLDELVEDSKIRPLPIVLASFSGGSKGCLYKVLQLVEGKCEGQLNKPEYQLVRDCMCGQLYDSSPVDFISELGTRFVLKMSQPPRLVSWMARGFASGMDALFADRFEAQRAEYWQTLYSTANMGPFLIFCSEDDDLAPYQVVCNFAQRLQELGGDVKVVKWISSPHVAHYKYHQAEYKAAVTEFLAKITVIYSQKHQRNEETAANDNSSSKISESVSNLSKAAVRPDKRLAVGPGDDFFLQSSMEFNGSRDGDSPSGYEQNSDLSRLPSINPHGVLSQILFDVCIPKNIEGWDIKPGMSLNGRQTFASGRRWHGPLNPLKFIRRSRL